MKKLFAVTEKRGRTWAGKKPMRSQKEWAEHASFMNGLAATGFVVLGGPIGESGDVMLVVDAEGKQEIIDRLSGDPWIQSGTIEVAEIRPWEILLAAEEKKGQASSLGKKRD
jgi:YCII-related domain-containing protein